METIVGTDGDDILRGDGQSAIFGRKGNDTIYLTGAEPWRGAEAHLDEGNDRYLVTDVRDPYRKISFDLNPFLGSPATEKGAIANFTKLPAAIDGVTVGSDTILDPWGGSDQLSWIPSVERLKIISGPNDDYVFVDSRFTMQFGLELKGRIGQDRLIAKSPPNIDLFSGGLDQKIVITAEKLGLKLQTKFLS